MAGAEEHLKQSQPAPAESGAASAETGVSRRRFLSGGAAAAALLLGARAAALTHDHGHQEAPEPPKSAEEQARFAKAEAAHYERFAEPPVVSGVNGVVDVWLHVVEVPITIRESTQTRTELTRTYNGQVPGPTISAYAGDRINVHFFNDLPKNSDPACEHHANPNTPHCFNTTNLHTHGLHVSPKVPSDAVLIEIPPLASDPVRGKLDFCFALPKSHKAGTTGTTPTSTASTCPRRGARPAGPSPPAAARTTSSSSTPPAGPPSAKRRFRSPAAPSRSRPW